MSTVTFLIAKPNQPACIAKGNGLEIDTYGNAIKIIAEQLKIAADELHLVIIDVAARKAKQFLEKKDEVPFRKHFTFLLRHKDEIWNVYASQTTPMTFTLAFQQRNNFSWSVMNNLPDEYKKVLLSISDKFLKSSLQILSYLNAEVVDNRKPNEDNYFDEEKCAAIWDKAGKIYEAPLGWIGIGIAVDPEMEKEVFDSWHVCYHATSALAVASILSHHTLALPGDTLLDGTVLKIPENHIPGENYIFASPSISYCEYGYAQKFKGFHFVLQLRMRPGSYFVQGDTLAEKSRKEWYHPFISSKQIEWVNPSRDDVVATRLWMKFLG